VHSEQRQKDSFGHACDTANLSFGIRTERPFPFFSFSTSAAQCRSSHYSWYILISAFWWTVAMEPSPFFLPPPPPPLFFLLLLGRRSWGNGMKLIPKNRKSNSAPTTTLPPPPPPFPSSSARQKRTPGQITMKPHTKRKCQRGPANVLFLPFFPFSPASRLPKNVVLDEGEGTIHEKH